MRVNLCAIALMTALTGCIAKHVSPTFTYPDAPEIVEYREVQTSKSLSGIVRDLQRGTIAAVLVEVLSEPSATRVDAVLSDKNGKFSLRPRSGNDVFLLRFSKPGFNTVVIHVKLNHDGGAHDLSITLPFSAGAGAAGVLSDNPTIRPETELLPSQMILNLNF